MPLPRLSDDLAIDLGSATTRLCVCGSDVQLSAPTLVAITSRPGAAPELLAVGAAAREMLGRAPSGVAVVRPVERGAVTDFEWAAALLEHLMREAGALGRLRRPRVAIAARATLCAVERRALRESVLAAGARAVHRVPRAQAAALGVGLPVFEPAGQVVIDIGAASTEVSVLSLGGVVCADAIAIGGDAMDAALIDWVKQHYGLCIGAGTAERARRRIGSAAGPAPEVCIEVKGRDVASGVPAALELKTEEACAALAAPVDAIVDCLRRTLERTPPEIAADIADRGVVMVGGGSLLHGLDARLRESTALPVFRADDPLDAVARGTARCLGDRALLARLEGVPGA